MKDTCGLILTFPKAGIKNGIIEEQFSTFYSTSSPSIGDIVGKITDWSLRNWYVSGLIDVVKIKRIYRMAFLCRRKKATEMCNVKNKPL
jgi:hypothetical protein